MSYRPLPAEFARQVHEAYSVAVKDRCRPQPLIDPVILAHEGGCVVAVNVNPYWLHPVGVRIKGETNDGYGGDVFAYPLRVGTTTNFLAPEQLPMYMASQPRRSAILLARVGGDELKVMFSRKGEYDLPVKVTRIDVEASTVELTPIHRPGSFVVPLDAFRMGQAAEAVCETT